MLEPPTRSRAASVVALLWIGEILLTGLFLLVAGGPRSVLVGWWDLLHVNAYTGRVGATLIFKFVSAVIGTASAYVLVRSLSPMRSGELHRLVVPLLVSTLGLVHVHLVYDPPARSTAPVLLVHSLAFTLASLTYVGLTGRRGTRRVWTMVTRVR